MINDKIWATHKKPPPPNTPPPINVNEQSQGLKFIQYMQTVIILHTLFPDSITGGGGILFFSKISSSEMEKQQSMSVF